jgi:mRNA interferase ChpB
LGFAVPLTEIKTTGVIRCDQPRVLDLAARQARWVDSVPDAIMDDVLARLSTLFE